MWTYSKLSGTLLVLALLLLLDARDASPVGAGTAATLPTFHLTACPVPLPMNQQAGVTVTCGYVVVPEDRVQPNGSTVALATMIYKSTASHPDPVPLMYLQGGPGSVALEPFASGIYDDMVTAVIASRDMVVFDQRGNGASLPSLACPEFFDVEATEPDVPIQDPEQLEPAAPKVERDPRLQALAACRDRLTRGGVNLDTYNSVVNAADVNDVRRALGYGKVNLYGVSYGTRLVQTVLKNYPEIVNSAIIDGVAYDDSSRGSSFDPTFQMVKIAKDLGLNRAVTKQDVMQYMYSRMLDYKPGSPPAGKSYTYSNYGYLLAGAVVEKVSGQKVFDYLRDTLLKPLSLTDVQPSPTAQSLKPMNEPPYESTDYGQNALDPSSTTQVPAPYGGAGHILEVDDSAAGLAASATALVKFIRVHKVWGNGSRSDYKSSEFPVARKGSDPGALSFAWSRADGVDWAVIFNCRDWPTDWDKTSDNFAASVNDLLDRTAF